MLGAAIAAALWLDADAGAPKCVPVDNAIDVAIAQKARELQGEEYCRYRMLHRADVDGDGIPDQLVIFGVEPHGGGTNSRQFLAVFPSRGKKSPTMTQVGARGLRFPRGVSTHANTITIATKEYTRDDAMCCPSKPGELELELKDGVLVPTKVPEPAPGQQAPAWLSKDQIHAVVMRHMAGVKYCYDKELQKDPNLEGAVSFAWTVKPDGHVESARIVESTLPSEAVKACILRQLNQWEFPKAGSPTPVGRFPFVFEPGADKR